MLHDHALEASGLAVEHKNLLFTKVIRTTRHVTLMVYKSIRLLETDGIYAPVREFLEGTDAILMHRFTEKAKHMDGGRAEVSMYMVWSEFRDGPMAALQDAS